tara:strand:- start:22121 stop:23152 length:1032 start_codon:yes stop_codon:yes gene_type:complete
MHYRKSFYNELSEVYDVTILHSGIPMVLPEDRFKEIIVRTYKIGPLYFQSDIFEHASKQSYDIIIAMFDIRWINSIWAMFNLDSVKPWIWWGLDKGVSSSNITSELALKVKLSIAKRGNPIIFYNKKIRRDFIKYGLNRKNLFVANNTFHIDNRIQCYLHEKKDYILFVGSLDLRKQNEILIKAFANILDKIPKSIKLVLIGDGEDKERLISLNNNLRLNGRVFFPGKITNASKLEEFYKRAIVSVSFGQAGLSVLQSMAYGVPFVTSENAISGGESNNIHHGKNGFICKKNIESLEEILIKCCTNTEYVKKMGKNAFEYYTMNSTVRLMIDSFEKAIKLSIN